MFIWFMSQYGKLDCNINVTNEFGETPMMVAAREGKLDIIKTICTRYKHLKNFNIDQAANDGWTSVCFAAMNGFCASIEMLVKHGAKVDTFDKFGRTPFHWAVRFGNAKVADLLLKLECNHNSKDLDGQTPYDLAEIHKHYEVIEVIEKYEKEL